MDLLQLCKWRYATKKMNPEKKLPADMLERILEAIRLAPTSSGLQPFEVLVITDAELKARIRKVAKDQSQVTDCSHLLLFAAWDTYTADRINMVFDQTIVDRNGSNEGWENYRRQLLEKYPARSSDENFQHAARQAYLALGFGLLAAANEGVDCTPMEGFDPAGVDEVFGLRERGLRSVLMLPLGYRDAGSDWLVGLNKSRRPKAQLFSFIE